MALVENIQRKDLDPIEIALSYNRLVEEINLTQNQLSQRVGKKRSTVANYMRLLKLDPIIQSGIRDGFLSMGHGRALINIEQQEEQLKIYEKIISKGLSVRNTEELVKKLNLGKEIKKNTLKFLKFISMLKMNFKKYLNSSVFVKVNKKGKGSIIIPFGSNKSLNDLIKRIKRED